MEKTYYININTALGEFRYEFIDLKDLEINFNQLKYCLSKKIDCLIAHKSGTVIIPIKILENSIYCFNAKIKH